MEGRLCRAKTPSLSAFQQVGPSSFSAGFTLPEPGVPGVGTTQSPSSSFPGAPGPQMVMPVLQGRQAGLVESHVLNTQCYYT